jgi:hypothetical protein
MKYRRLTTDTHDMCFGRGMGDYLEDKNEDPVAIAQAIKTRLLLFYGEWWMNTLDGLPMWQQMLGQRIRSIEIIDKIIVERIRDTQLPDETYPITNISGVSSDYNSTDREYSFNCVVDTIYGKLYITNATQGGS